MSIAHRLKVSFLDAEIDFGHCNNVSTIDVKFFPNEKVANVTAILLVHTRPVRIFQFYLKIKAISSWEALKNA